MANAACVNGLQMCGMRVTRLDGTGAIFQDGGANSSTGGTGGLYVTDTIVEADFSFNVEDGTELEVRTACGDLCANFTECDTLRNIEIDLTLCKIDPELIALLTGSGLISVGGLSIGNTVASGKQPSCDEGVILEFWQKAWNMSEQNADPYSYIRWVFPRVRLNFSSDFSFENDFLTLSLSGDTLANSSAGTGPDEDWPQAPGSNDHMMYFLDSSANYDALVASVQCSAQDIGPIPIP